MKTCSKCKCEKELNEFPFNRTTKDGREYSCKSCQNEYTKVHYKKNKKQYLTRNERRRKEAREYVLTVKKNNKCKLCPEDRWWVLDFHHVVDKKEEISNLLSHGIEIIKKEIEKCDILCVNCHRDLHHNENTHP